MSRLFSDYAEVLFNEPMSRHTSFKIGGSARVFLTPKDIEGIKGCISLCRDTNFPYITVGRGSNLVFPDRCFRGAVIHMGENFGKITVEGCKIRAQAGAMLYELCRAAQSAGLTGLEFAYGIPGSVGGGIFMNAGAYGGELKDTCESVTVLTDELEEKTYPRCDCDFSYRHSRFMEDNSIITEAVFCLKQGDKAEISAQMDDIMKRRIEKQPLEYPSAGSVFRRPEGHFAGALIEQAGLKGARIGGAEVSEKHAGFIINRGDATCSDVRSLVGLIQNTVFSKYGVSLECEIRFVGEKE